MSRENKRQEADIFMHGQPKNPTATLKHKVVVKQCSHGSARYMSGGSNKCRGCGIIWDIYSPTPMPRPYTVRVPLAQPIAKTVKTGVLV